MKTHLICLSLLFYVTVSFAQKDSLQLGDSYADDQFYLSVSYAQLHQQPSSISKSNFSYSLSAGFIKDLILNKTGSLSMALGAGYGYSSFNHKLKIEDINVRT